MNVKKHDIRHLFEYWKNMRRGDKATESTIFMAFIVIMIVFSIIAPNFFSVSNIRNALRQNSALFLIACGQTYVIMLGGIDLSQGNLVGFASVISAYAMLKYGYLAGIIAGLMISILCGAITGGIIVKGNVQPFVAALGMQFIIYGMNLLISGGNPIYNLPEAVSYLGNKSILGIPDALILAIIVGIISHVVLKKTILGRSIYAVGGNRKVSFLSGISPKLIIFIAWLINGLLVGLGSMILMSRVGSGQPALGGTEVQMQSIAAAVVGGNSFDGGKGSIVATLVGTLFIGFLINGLNIMGLNQFIREVIIGIVIISSVIRREAAIA